MKRPFALIGFSSAVTLLLLNIISTEYTFAITVGVGAVFVFSVILPKYRQDAVIPLCLGSALFSCAVFLLVYNASVVPCINISGKAAEATFYITDLPHKTGEGYLYYAKTKSILLSGAPQEIKFRLKSDTPIASAPYTLMHGRLRFYLTGKAPFVSGGTWGKGTYLTARFNDIFSDGVIENKLMYFISEMRINTADKICKTVGGDSGALAAALVTGYRDRISASTYDAFKTAGAAHIMAVSGLHLTVISSSVRGVLNLIGIRRKLSSLVIIAVIIFYCAFTGFSSSVVRAGIMLTVYFFGDLINRKSDPLNSLGFTVFIICLNPFAPTDVSAVMSVSAVLAVIVSSKTVVKANEKLRKKQFFKTLYGEALVYAGDSVIASSFTAAFLLPVYYLYFGYCSLAGILINIFIVPLGSLSTVLSTATALLIRTLGINPLAQAQRLLCDGIIYLVKMSAGMPLAAVTLEKYFGAVLGAVFLAAGLCLVFGKRRLIKYTAVLGVAAFFVCAVAGNIQTLKTARVCITENGAVAVNDGDNTVVCGVNCSSDVIAIKRFLNLKDGKLDVMFADGGGKYTVAMSEAVSCQKIISPFFSADLIENTDCGEYENSASAEGNAGNISYSFSFDGKTKFIIKSKGITVASGDSYPEADIKIYEGAVVDSKGAIDLDGGDVVYYLHNDSTYSVRRINLWQD